MEKSARSSPVCRVQPAWEGKGRTVDVTVCGQARDKELKEQPGLKRFVTFYFSNFPPFLSNFYLRKGFEVCGMLEDVIVPSKRDVNGERYGFVRFANVRNVSKLLKAVNEVYFGNFRVRA